MNDYKLVRSSRKTLALSMDRAGALTVRAPYYAAQAQIDAFVQEKQSWVHKTRAHMASLPPREKLSLADGAGLPYLGQKLAIRLADIRQVKQDSDILLVPSAAPEAAVTWLEAQARRELQEHSACLSRNLGIGYTSFRLTRAKGRWGSMSSRRTLSLNRALILCPPDIIDYVVVHELCHIPHPDHSKAFWAHVERCMPDYRIRRDWLKAHSELINYLPDRT
ncbi:MAG: SprT family zinc-dependent metalloprotease [Eubacteriales bacterium]|nr:SprT family zinc-dependent metalloprotease [Eubacteriales bacterium]